MDLSSLRAFIDVARRGNFAAAARDRNVDPSSMSRIIAALEEELGLRLFQRTTRRLALTEAGERYLHRVEALVDELEQARDEALTINAGPSGTLRMTASVAFGSKCIVPLLADFRAAFPSLKLELLLDDSNLDLVAERLDLALRLAPSIHADVVGARLFATRYRVCASPAYLANARTLSAPADLGGHSCLRFALPEFRSRWLFRSAGGEIEEVAVDGDVLISNALALRECAIAGMGPALLANWLIDDDLAAGRLIDAFPAYHVAAASFDTAAWLLYPSRAFLPNKVRVSIDFFRRKLSREAPALAPAPTHPTRARMSGRASGA